MRVRAFSVAVAMAIGDTGCSGDDAPGNGAVASPTSTTVEAAEPGCDPARPATAETAARVLVHDGLERRYELSVPPGYDGVTPVPLVLNLHGFGGDGARQNAGTGMPEQAGARGYVVVAPDGGPLSVPSDAPAAEGAARFDGIPFWNFFGDGAVSFGDGSIPGLAGDASQLGADDVAFVNVLLDELAGELCIDEARVYSTGMSNGAGMSTTLGCELGDRLTAIAPVAGVNLSGECPGVGSVAVLAIHGDADEAVHYTGNHLLGFELGNPSVADRMAQWAQRNGCAEDPEVDEPVAGVVRTTWTGCTAATELWTVAGWGHAWPSTSGDAPAPFDATEVVLDFFDEHPERE